MICSSCERRVQLQLLVRTCLHYLQMGKVHASKYIEVKQDNTAGMERINVKFSNDDL